MCSALLHYTGLKLVRVGEKPLAGKGLSDTPLVLVCSAVLVRRGVANVRCEVVVVVGATERGVDGGEERYRHLCSNYDTPPRKGAHLRLDVHTSGKKVV